MKENASNVLLLLALVCMLIATFKPTLAAKTVVNWMAFGFSFMLAAVLVPWLLTFVK